MGNIDLPSLRYNAEAINKDVPIREVIERYTGIDTSVRGNIPCPSQSHGEKTPPAHIYDTHGKNNCFCFSCLQNFNPIDIVMQHTQASFPEACKILIDDFGLPLSSYSNITEIEYLQEQQKAAEQGIYVDMFPLTKEDCDILGYHDAFATQIPNPDYEEQRKFYSDAQKYIPKCSIVETWKQCKEAIEGMILNMSIATIEDCRKTIEADTSVFGEIYSLHTPAEWKEAQKIQNAVGKYNIGMFSQVQLSEKQRHMVDDITELQSTAERIAENEDKIKAVEAIRDKVLVAQNDRAEHANNRQPSRPQYSRER
mgnify:CR=1 FL=1|jgi:hypothetical protein